nr:putative transporter c3h1.06c [Quercus suber]
MQKTTRYLEGRQLICAVVALNAANGISFIDLLGITAILPLVGISFNAEETIAWAATSQLIGATIGQCLLGYLSDLYSRRRMLQAATLLLAISAIACALSSYARSGPLLYTIRALAGVATGSVSNLVNIAQNDFLPVHRRGKYQGIQGVSVGLGSIVGVLAGAGFTANMGRWEALYYMEFGLALAAFALICLYVPANVQPPKGSDIRSTLREFDTYGILTGIGFIVPLLILMCQGSGFGADSPVTIALIVLMIICGMVFMYLGFQTRPVRPVIPFVLFRNRTITAIFVQNVLFGAVYYAFTYFVPLYLQTVREFSPLTASALFVPYFVTHGIWSTISGLIVSHLQNRGRKSYSYVLTFGFSVWTLAMGLLAWYSYSRTPSLGHFVGLEILVGLGTGSTFQNSIMAIRAQVTAEHNAVAVSARNVLRFFGGALGIAVSSVVLEERLKWTMPWRLEWISDTAFSRPPTGSLDAADRELAEVAYARAIAWVWYVAAGMVGLCMLLCFLVRDTRVVKTETKQTSRENLEAHTLELSRVPISSGKSDTLPEGTLCSGAISIKDTDVEGQSIKDEV